MSSYSSISFLLHDSPSCWLSVLVIVVFVIVVGVVVVAVVVVVVVVVVSVVVVFVDVVLVLGVVNHLSSCVVWLCSCLYVELHC